jgi:hypothetical protein
MYVVDKDGRRVNCPHPGEMYTVIRVLGPNPSEELINHRTGFNSYCVCYNCLKKFELDLKRDARVCPECQSVGVKSVMEARGHECPNCMKGIIEEIETGIVC